MNKRVALLLIVVLAVSSLIAVKPAPAEAPIPKPSVPEFTVKLVDSSYDVPTTYSTNPYTGEKVTHPGYRVESRTIEIKIKNQPFTPFLVEEATANWTVGLQYVIRWKGHYGQDWYEIYYDNPMDGFTGFSANLESEYTVISFEGNYSSSDGLKLIYQGLYTTFPPDAQVDFQVKARIGYDSRYAVPFTSGWAFTGEESDWSNTQTLTINTNVSTTTPDTSPSQNSTATPDQSGSQTVASSGLDWAQFATLVLFAVIAVLLVAVIVYLRRRSTK